MLFFNFAINCEFSLQNLAIFAILLLWLLPTDPCYFAILLFCYTLYTSSYRPLIIPLLFCYFAIVNSLYRTLLFFYCEFSLQTLAIVLFCYYAILTPLRDPLLFAILLFCYVLPTAIVLLCYCEFSLQNLALFCYSAIVTSPYRPCYFAIMTP